MKMLEEGKKYTWEKVKETVPGLSDLRRYVDADHFEVTTLDGKEVHRFGGTINGKFVYEGAMPGSAGKGECNG
jgi:hypothetical protein